MMLRIFLLNIFNINDLRSGGICYRKIFKTVRKVLLIGIFKAEDSEPSLPGFLFKHNARNVNKDKARFKSVNNSPCIDLFITNSPLCFQNATAISTGLSDFRKMVLTVIKMFFSLKRLKRLFVQTK